jgi:carboxyl-terminal processing protease
MVKKNKWAVLSAMIILLVFSIAFIGPQDQKKDQVLLELIEYGLMEAHYSPKAFDDDLSEDIFDLYLEMLDPGKRIFLASDVEQFGRYRTLLDDEIRGKSLSFFDLSYGVLTQRSNEAVHLYEEILAEPFNFKKKEYLETDPDKLNFPATEKERYEAWRKYLKYQVLLRLNDYLEDDTNDKSFDENEAKAREKVTEAMKQWSDRMEELERKDWRSMYVNAITACFDPHTNYLAPYDMETFEFEMSGKMEGIGARLTTKDGYIKIHEIVPGSACWRQGDLKEGDLILKVGQENEEPVDVVGMRIEEAVKLIRGPKGTTVKLTVKKIDGVIKVIPIVRDVVVIEETYARSAVLEDNGNKYGYVQLPKFYVNYDGEGRDCGEDVKNEVIKLKEEGVEGIVLDLRNNGGGSLQAAIDIVGIFIEQGPVVQVKGKKGPAQSLKDADPTVVWDGPLVVLVNSFSASASEIVAAALQDYQRAVIIGSAHTFGKGTVQSMFDFDPMLPSELDDIKPMGSVKMTIQKFYRINGHTTQLDGVTPHIVLPDRYNLVAVGEKDTDHPLPWDELLAVDYSLYGLNEGIINMIRSSSESRTDTSRVFNKIEEQAVWVKERRETTTYPLRLKDHQDEQAYVKTRSDEFGIIGDYRNDLEVLVPASYVLETSDSIAQARQERFHKRVKKDIYLEEGVEVLKDIANP